MRKHAYLSASGAPAWMRCAAKPWRERDYPAKSNVFADEGTAAHYLLSECLVHSYAPATKLGAKLFVDEHGDVYEVKTDKIESGSTFVVNQEMVEAVEQVIRSTQGYEINKTLFAEQRVSISAFTTEKGGEGTADLVLIDQSKITISDLKYGIGVMVEAEDNEQLMLYAAGTLAQFNLAGDIEEVTMRIEQPRLHHTSEWTIPVAELNKRMLPISVQGERILSAEGGENLPATPGEKQCKFCNAKGSCPEYRDYVFNSIQTDLTVVDDTKNIVKKIETAATHVSYTTDEQLIKCMSAVNMIDTWCEAVRSEVYRRLLNGTPMDGSYKLVQGRGGSRRFTDNTVVEQMLKSFEIKKEDIYDIELKSPTQLEQLLKRAYPDKWAKLQEYIAQAPGKLTVAAWDDKRPAVSQNLQFIDYTKES